MWVGENEESKEAVKRNGKSNMCCVYTIYTFILYISIVYAVQKQRYESNSDWWCTRNEMETYIRRVENFYFDFSIIISDYVKGQISLFIFIFIFLMPFMLNAGCFDSFLACCRISSLSSFSSSTSVFSYLHIKNVLCNLLLLLMFILGHRNTINHSALCE